MIPDGAEHLLTGAEGQLIGRVLEKGGRKHEEVEDIVTRPAQVEVARLAPFGAANDVEDRALNVNIAAQREHPRVVRRDVVLHEGENEENEPSDQAKDNEHDSAVLPILGAVELGNEGHGEAGPAGDAQQCHVDAFVDCHR